MRAVDIALAVAFGGALAMSTEARRVTRWILICAATIAFSIALILLAGTGKGY